MPSNEIFIVDQKYKYPSASNMFLPKRSADIFNRELQLLSKIKAHQVQTGFKVFHYGQLLFLKFNAKVLTMTNERF
jgi:hypothetical protein